jgi:serine/threonine protein kinase
MPIDFWMLGVLAYTMLVGHTPFFDKDPMMIYQNIIKVKYHFPKGKIDKYNT